MSEGENSMHEDTHDGVDGTLARVAALFVHPLKSAAGIPVDELPLDARGAVGDRRWLLVDEDGVAITARERHRLLLVAPSFATTDRDGPLQLTAPGMQPIVVPVPDGDRAASLSVQVWADTLEARHAGADAAEWCSDAIGARCTLVRIAPDARRPLAPKFAGPVDRSGRHVAFSDGAPLLLLGQGSLDALNDRLEAAGSHRVPVQRFRPNVLLTGTAPHEEDTWRMVRIGDVALGVGSPCSRCVLTTVDHHTATAGIEPLRTLAEYRRAPGGVMFGMNCSHVAPGVIRLGDAAVPLERQ